MFSPSKSKLPYEGKDRLIEAMAELVAEVHELRQAINLYLNEFWEYDPQTTTWAKKVNFPGTQDLKGYGIISDTETTDGGIAR